MPRPPRRRWRERDDDQTHRTSRGQTPTHRAQVNADLVRADDANRAAAHHNPYNAGGTACGAARFGKLAPSDKGYT